MTRVEKHVVGVVPQLLSLLYCKSSLVKKKKNKKTKRYKVEGKGWEVDPTRKGRKKESRKYTAFMGNKEEGWMIELK